MPSKCYVPGCKTGYASNKLERKLCVFGAPRDQKMLEEWRKAIPRFDKTLTPKDKVCELHFTEDCINRVFEYPISGGGTIRLMKREKVSLKKGAIPTVFPKNVQYLQKRKYKERLSNTKTSPSKRKRSSNENLDCKKMTLDEHAVTTINDDLDLQNPQKGKSKKSLKNVKTYLNRRKKSSNANSDIGKMTLNEHTATTIKGDPDKYTIKDTHENVQQIVDLNEMSETFSYSTLVNDLDCIAKPDSLWGVTAQNEFIMCAKWSEDSTLMKRIIIDCNLNILVFFKGRAIDFENVKIGSVRDVCSILKEIDSCGICKNVNNLETAGCDGYILPDSQSNLCEYCQLTGNLEVSRRKDFYWLSKGKNFIKHLTLYDKIHRIKRETAQLKEQLNKIIHIKAVWKLSQRMNPNPIQ